MSRHSSNTSFEIHTYDGGFKPELVPGGARPDILPDPAGPRSNELELAEGDYAVELVFSIRKKRKVVWIGYYTFGVDRQLGRRGNYSGVGIWLVDLAPIYVGRLLKLLREAALEVSRNQGVSQTIRDKLSDVAVDAELDWYVPYDRLPNQFWTARFNSASADNTTYLAVPEDEGVGLSLIAADILHHFSKKPREEITSPRYLYLLRRSSKVAHQGFSDLELGPVLASEEDAVWDFCEAAAEPIAKQNELIAGARKLQELLTQTTIDAQNRTDELTQRCTDLGARLAESERARAAIANTFDAVSKLIPNIGNAATAMPNGQSDNALALNQIRRLAHDSWEKLTKIDRNVSQLQDAVLHRSAPNKPARTEPIYSGGPEVNTYLSEVNGRMGGRHRFSHGFIGRHLRTIIISFGLAIIAAVAAFIVWAHFGAKPPYF